MRLKPTKIVTFLLLTAFLVTSLGSMFGYVCCDHGCLSDIHIGNHVDDHTASHVDVHIGNHCDVHVDDYIVSLDQHIGDSDDPCLDSPITLGEGIVKKSEIIKWQSNLATIPANESQATTKNTGLVVRNSPLKFPPRISQTILTHRTVVILT